MRLSDYIALALRNITRRKLRSALTIFAIVIGATSVTIMLTIVFSAKGFINGQFEQNGTYQQVAVSPQTDLTWGDGGGPNCNSSDCVKLTQPLIDEIAKLPHITGIARRTQPYNFDGLFLGEKKLRLNQVVAYDANDIIQDHMLAGRDIMASDGEGVVTITSDYADALGYKNNYQALVGRTVQLHTQSFYSGVGSDPIAQYTYMQTHCQNQPGQNCTPPSIEIPGKIVGIADANGVTGGDGYTVRVPLSWARGMEENQMYGPAPGSNHPDNSCANRFGPCAPSPPKLVLTTTDELAINGYSSLIVKVDQSSNAASVAKAIRTQFKLGAADAETAIKQQLSIFNILGIILGGLGGIALAVAAVGVINTMIMSILERTREIGVMRAVGAKRATVSRLFTFEAALLGFAGGVIGVLIGYGLTLIGNPLINHQLKGNNIQSSNILSLPTWLVVSVIAGTTIIGILAGLYPAHKAAKLNPVEALHYE